MPDEDFNYDEFVRQEFGSSFKPAGMKTIWWITAILITVASRRLFSRRPLAGHRGLEWRRFALFETMAPEEKYQELNLAVWFGLHVIFPPGHRIDYFASHSWRDGTHRHAEVKWPVIPVVRSAVE